MWYLEDLDWPWWALVGVVVGLEVVHQEEGPDTSVLGLRISGDDVPPFDATYRGRHRPDHRVGAGFDAVVDPPDDLFALKPGLGPR
ncbi:hypothetical protein ABTZ99_28630 [Actinosynnema sp. NPDC002837]